MKLVYPMSVIGDKEGIYTDPRNCQAYFTSEALEKAENFSVLDWEGVNGGTICRNSDGTFWIANLSGFTYDRGIFCDSYTKDGEKTTII